MAGLDEGQDESVLQHPETIMFQGHSTYLLNDLITYDRAFFVGCIREPRKTIQKKNIPDDQYWFATYSKRNDTWSPATPKTVKPRSSYVRTGFTTTYPNLLDTRALTSTNLYHLC